MHRNIVQKHATKNSFPGEKRNISMFIDNVDNFFLFNGEIGKVSMKLYSKNAAAYRLI